MNNNVVYLVLGLIAGLFGGLLGIGGATILIPALVFLCGLTQHQAQGTTLAAMVPPIALLAAIRYYQAGHVKLWIALLIALGFFIGGYFGAVLAEHIPGPVLKKVFGLFLLFVSLRMIFVR